MAIRNSYIQATVDGRKTRVTGGPRSKDGGMEVTITQRNKGEIATALRYHQVSDGNGRIVSRITVYDLDTQEIIAEHYIGSDRD